MRKRTKVGRRLKRGKRPGHPVPHKASRMARPREMAK
jgi:hypothetical protein